MKRKNMTTAFLCTLCLAASSVAAPAVVMAEETEAVSEAVEEQTETEALVRPEYKALDYVTLGTYKGLEVTKETLEVTEDEIQEEIRLDVQLAEALEEYTEGQVQEGDTANIDYEGKLDGEAFDGGTAKGYDLEIGSHTFIDGFEDGLIGVSVGETVDLTLTFPENYGNADLAGQETVFTVTVNSIKRMPELTDELVNTITDGDYTDVESYRNSISEELMADKESQEENVINSELLTLIANTSEVKDYPQEMVDYSTASMKSYYQQDAEAYGLEFAEFLQSFFGLTEEEFNDEVDAVVKQNLQQEMYLQAIAEEEGLEISEEDFAAGCEEYAQRYGYDSKESLVEAYGEETIRLSLLQEKVMDFVRENAVITEEAESETGAETEIQTEE